MTADPDSIINAANTALAQANTPEAERLGLALEALIGRHPVVLDILGRAAIARGQTDRAVALYHEAAAQLPDDAGIRLTLALLHFNAKEMEAAQRFAEDACARGLEVTQFLRATAVQCQALYLLGRRGDARRILDARLGDLARGDHPLIALIEDRANADFLLAAAASAHDVATTEAIFRARFTNPRAPIAQIGISKIEGWEKWSRNASYGPRTLQAAEHILIDERAHGSGRWDYTTDAYEVFEIPGAEIVSGWDFVLNAEGHVLDGSGYSGIAHKYPFFLPHEAVADAGLVAHVWGKTATLIDETVLFLSTPEQFHVGHFIVDFLPRLRALGGNTTMKVVVPTEITRKHSDLLRLCGIGEDRLIFCDLGNRYRFRSLMIARTGSYLKPNPETLQFVRKHLAAPAARPGEKRLYLERDVGTRQIVNHADLDALLTAMKFERVNLAKFSIAAQRELFAGARVVVGVFGSDLLCAYFLPAGADLIELTWDPAEDPVVGPTCEFFGIKHQFLTCAEAPGTSYKRYNKDRDIVVNCAELQRRLEAILGQA